MGANVDATVADGVTFEKTDASFMFLVTLSAEDNAKLVKQLNEGFNRPVYWNKYKVIDNKLVEIAAANEEKHIRKLPHSSYQGVKRLFVLAYENTAGNDQVSDNSFKKYFLPRVKIENYNIEIDGRNFYDQPINELIKQDNEVRKVSIGRGNDYTTGCLLDFCLFGKKNYRLIAADLSKQKALDADSRAIPQIIFTGKADKKIRAYILEKSKEAILEFSKGTTKVL